MKPTLQIFEAASGYPSLKVTLEDNSVKHIHSSVAPEKEYLYFEDITLNKNNILFLGFGAGYHIIDKIEDIPNDKELIVVDFFEELTENAKKNLLSNSKVKTINCNSSDLEIKNTLSNFNNCQIIKHPASYNSNPEFYDRILSFVNIRKENSISNTKKIMLLYGTFFLENELLNAIEESDKCDLCKFPYSNFISGYEFENQLYSYLQKETPDLIISINCKGFDGEGYLAKLTYQFEIPVAVWFVDDPHPILLNQKQHLRDNIFAFCWEKSYIGYLNNLNFKSVDYLPLACDPTLFTFKQTKVFNTQVGFIGSSMGIFFLDEIKHRFIWHQQFENLSKVSALKLLQNSSQHPWHLIKKCANDLQIEIPFNDERNMTWLCSYVIHTASMILRKNIMESLQDIPIEIFGDPQGWKELLGENFILHPNIDYRTGLCKGYQNIAININITSRQMPSAVNQRVFDIPMSGSFIISDNQDDMHNLFEIGTEAIVYDNAEDLKDKIIFYLSAPSQRKEISLNAKKRILNEHTYLHRLNTIIDSIFS